MLNFSLVQVVGSIGKNFRNPKFQLFMVSLSRHTFATSNHSSKLTVNYFNPYYNDIDE